VNIFIKDLGIVLDAARKLAFPLPLAAPATSSTSPPPRPAMAPRTTAR
jgi:3-hydroxyisobutyrate dehydrogenase-like beta-hydroxyacid dehydrogenase